VRRHRRRFSLARRLLVVTLLVGLAAVVVLPQAHPGRNATVAPRGATTFEQASLTDLSRPVSAAIAAHEDELKDLKVQAQKVAKIKKSDALPGNSGAGRRIVFSEAAQRVWLVGAGGNVERTYLVSGSKYDNLNPGTYSVLSKSRSATAFDYSGTMEYFVRFATGFTAPIGFHTVPVDNTGRPEQSKQDLGTPQSAGCVRQWPDDAIALWNFAPVGTPVVVTA
jgi:lipoprotein-anchoring transpeptidase ErfK/SrfK